MTILKKKYFNKNILKTYLKKKMYIKNWNKFIILKDTKVIIIKKNQIYYPIYEKNFINLYLNTNYESYQNNINWIKLNYLNLIYPLALDILKTKIEKTVVITENLKKLNIINTKKLKLINSFIYNYNFFISLINFNLFFIIKIKNLRKTTNLYFLTLSFKKNKIFINLNDNEKKSYLTLSSGLFIKFFENKKSFKKNKTIKILMIKYIRKIFLITRIINTILFIKKTPSILNEIVNFFNLPIAHKFLNPIENKFIEENLNNFIWIKFLYFIFIENKNFCKNKLPQKGRIKRKILRKITFENKIID